MVGLHQLARRSQSRDVVTGGVVGGGREREERNAAKAADVSRSHLPLALTDHPRADSARCRAEMATDEEDGLTEETPASASHVGWSRTPLVFGREKDN